MSRQRWGLIMAGIIASGILSRVVHTGWIVFDKYLGDALYAAMVFWMVRPVLSPGRAAAWGMTVMTGIECFQLTMIPARMLQSEYLAMRICARLIGVQFSFRDMLAYAVGIAAFWATEKSLVTSQRRHTTRLP